MDDVGRSVGPGPQGAVSPQARRAPDPWSETELTEALHAVRQGDETAFRLLYRATQPRLLRYVRSLVGDDAEDVTSEAWLQIARDLRAFKGDFKAFRGWAATVARNRALDHLRSKQRRPSSDAGVEELSGIAALDDTAVLALDGMSTEATIELIMRLPRDQAEAVLLRVLMGLDARAAGRVLGKRAGAVRTAAYRGLRKLAERMEHTEPADDGENPVTPATAPTLKE